jgi:predicted nucleic acid-binding protein
VLGLKQPQHADELLSEMLDVELPEVSPRSYSRRILGLMRRHGATFYDAGYHALAIERSGVMVTADRRHIAKCGRMGHLRFIGDWPLPR